MRIYAACPIGMNERKSIAMPWFSKKSYILQNSVFFYFLLFHFKAADIINN